MMDDGKHILDFGIWDDVDGDTSFQQELLNETLNFEVFFQKEFDSF